MKTSMGELVDRYTILKIKQEKGVCVDPIQIDEIYEVIGNNVSHREIDQLLLVNELAWETEDVITEENNLTKIGTYYLMLRTINKLRLKEKNKLTIKYGGYEERKNY